MCLLNVFSTYAIENNILCNNNNNNNNNNKAFDNDDKVFNISRRGVTVLRSFHGDRRNITASVTTID